VARMCESAHAGRRIARLAPMGADRAHHGAGVSPRGEEGTEIAMGKGHEDTHEHNRD
jgi:hypothetical protein